MAIGQINKGVGKGIQEKRWRERAKDKQVRKLVWIQQLTYRMSQKVLTILWLILSLCLVTSVSPERRIIEYNRE